MTREERGKKAAYFRTEAGLARKKLDSRLHLTENKMMALSCLLGRLTNIRFCGQAGFRDIYFD